MELLSLPCSFDTTCPLRKCASTFNFTCDNICSSLPVCVDCMCGTYYSPSHRRVM